jgi:hypothetical protein
MQSDKSRRKKALFGTVVFHVLLLVFFMLTGLTQPDPLPEEIGVEISLANIGDSYTGSGETEPTEVAPPSNAPAPTQPVVQPTAIETPQPAEEVVSDANSDVSVNKKSNKEEKKPEKPKEEEKKPEPAPKPTVNTKALYPGSKASDNPAKADGGSQGNKGGEGNMGSVEGKKEGKGILGGGQGSWELSGRSLLEGARIDDTDEEGIVVLNIWVDRYGKVQRTTPNLSKSTTTSQKLFEKAKKAAMLTRYSPKGDAATEQKGLMTFKFILR